jgi:hypothetical protein
MSPAEFVGRAVGLPWKRWRSDWEAADCFGLIVLVHIEVLGIDLGPVPRTDIASGFSAARGWVECVEEEGATCFMTWRDGAPTHCGWLAGGGMVLHAQEGYPVPEHGSTRLTRLSVLKRACPDIRFYRYEGACSPS